MVKENESSKQWHIFAHALNCYLMALMDKLEMLIFRQELQQKFDQTDQQNCR